MKTPISKKTWMAAFAAVTILFTACSKTGPAGPQGAQGPQGDQGVQGTHGDQGETGSANVIYSSWFAPTTWNAETVYGYAERTFSMTTSSLTQSIIDNGVVLVYMKFYGFPNSVYQLPVALDGDVYNFGFRAQAGSVKAFYYDRNSYTVTPSVIPSSNQVRYVLIPGAVPGLVTSNAPSKKQLESMTYEEVCDYYNIPK